EVIARSESRDTIEGKRIAVAAPLRQRYRMRRARRNRMLEKPRGHQVPRAARTSGVGIAPDLVVPRGDVAAGIERSADAGEHCWTVRLPEMLIRAHPLHAHGAPRHGPCNECRIRRRVVGAIVAVAS